MNVTYSIRSDFYDDNTPDYVALVVHINGQYEGTLTGFCDPAVLRKIVTGEAQDEDR